MTLSWLWCWCRFMSASPGFHSGYWAVPALIGIHAFPPSLSCESFWVLSTVHSFTFTFIFVIVITELNFFAWVLSSSSYHSTWTLCTPPHQPNHAHPISVCNTFCCVWQKVHLASCTLLLYVAKNFDWSSSPIADLMMRTRNDPWDKIVIILWEPKKNFQKGNFILV